jgi:hypothetical protein
LSLSAHLEPTVAWRELRAELRRIVGDSTYEIWLASLELNSVHEREVLVDAPTATYVTPKNRPKVGWTSRPAL